MTSRRFIPLVAVVAILLFALLGGPPDSHDAAPGKEPDATGATAAAPLAEESDSKPEDKGPRRGHWDDRGPPAAVDTTYVVVSDKDGAPIEGALVHVSSGHDVEPREGLTDARGRVDLCRWGSSARVTVRARGFLTVRTVLREIDGTRVIRMTPAVALPGRVLLTGTREPISGARVRAWIGIYDDDLDVEVVTGPDGGFEIAGVPRGQAVTVAAAYPGLAPATVSVRFSTDRSSDGGGDPVELILGSGASIVGTVRDREGRPVAVAEVFPGLVGEPTPLFTPQFPGMSEDRHEFLKTYAVADARGRYLVSGLATPAEYVVHARASTGAYGHGEAVAIREPTSRVRSDVTVLEPAKLFVKVLDPDGKEIPDADLRLTLDLEWGEAPEHLERTWDPEAEERAFVDVAPGKHLVYVRPDEHPEFREEVHLEPGEVARITLRVKAGGEITGSVVDTEGDPVAGVYVTFLSDGEPGQTRCAETGEDGTFLLTGIGPGPGELSVSHGGWTGAVEQDVVAGGDVGRIVVERGARVVCRLVGLPDGAEVSTIIRVNGKVSGSWGELEEGRVDTGLVQAGVPFDLIVQTEGRAPQVFANLVLEPAEVRDLGEVELNEGRTVAALVTDSGGKPLPGARVVIAEDWFGGEYTSDDAGRIELTGLPDAPVLLKVSADGQPVAFFGVGGAQEGPLTFRIPRGGEVRGRLLDLKGQPVRGGGDLILYEVGSGAPDPRRSLEIEVDSLGGFRALVAPGRYRLVFHTHERPTPNVEGPAVHVKDGEISEVEFRLSDG